MCGRSRSTSCATRSSACGRPCGWTYAAAASTTRAPSRTGSCRSRTTTSTTGAPATTPPSTGPTRRSAADGVFYGFYERLFDEGTLRDLCAFLGIDFHAPDLGRQVNVSPKDDGEPRRRRPVRALAQRFAPVYEAVGAPVPRRRPRRRSGRACGSSDGSGPSAGQLVAPDLAGQGAGQLPEPGPGLRSLRRRQPLPDERVELVGRSRRRRTPHRPAAPTRRPARRRPRRRRPPGAAGGPARPRAGRR